MIDKLDLNYKAIKLRERLNINSNRLYIDIENTVKDIHNLTLICFPAGENVSGVTIKTKKASLIFVNSNMTLGRQRFSFGHELYHLYFDEDDTTFSVLNYGSDDEKEKKADLFASYFFAPYEILREEFEKINNLNINSIIMLSQNFGLSYDAIINRLVEDNFISLNEAQKLKPKSLIQSVKKSEYLDGVLLYQPTKIKRTIGCYIDNAKYLLDKNIISTGKYNELLHLVYRNDLII